MWIVTNSDSTCLFSGGRIVPFDYGGPCPTINSVVMEKQGFYLLGADQGLFEYAGRRFTRVKLKNALNDKAITWITAMNDSTFAMADKDAAMFKVIQRNGGTFRVIATIRQRPVTSTLVDHAGKLWIGSTSGGIRIISVQPGNPDSIRPEPLPPPLLALKYTQINCLLEDETHTIWIGTDKGLVRWTVGSAVQRFTIGIDIGTNYISCLFQDREKNIWIGTMDGLCKLVKPVVTYYDSEEKLSKSFFMSIRADSIRNRVYLPQLNKVITIDDNGNVANLPLSIDASRGILSMIAGRKTFWFLLDDPRLKYTVLAKADPFRPGAKSLHVTFEKRIPDSAYFHIQPDQHGNLFLCGPGGLAALYGKNLCRWPELWRYFDAITFDHLNHLWLGTFIDGGIYEYELEYRENTIRLRLLQHYVGQLYDRDRSAVCDQDGNVWFGTRLQGLLRFGLDKAGNVTSIDHLSMREGLSDNAVFAVYEDFDKDLWVGTGTGVDRVSFRNGHYLIRNYGREINYAGGATGIAQTPDGDFWLAANFAGVTRFTYSKPVESLPPVVFTRIFASGNKDSTIPINADGLRLAYNENNLDFDFTAVTFKNEKLVAYSYWLEGASKDWSQMSLSHSIHLVSLPPGIYTLKVRARLANGLVSDKMALFHFEILHAIWDTWVFKCLIIAAILLILYGIYRYRIAQLSKIYVVRDRLSKDLHDDIGSTLSSINILSGIATGRMQEGYPEQSISILSRINRYTAEVTEKMSDIVWAINPENETVENLVHRLRRAAAETCSVSHIDLEFEVDDNLARRKLGLEFRKNIYLIAKEAMNNAIKHANCRRISVAFQAMPKGLLLAVMDDGSGFDAATCVKGNGLKNMVSRAKEIRAELQIQSARGSTKLTLLTPVP
jgi:signal transduction histidine kinase